MGRTVDAVVAAPGRDGSFGHARSFGIVNVLRHCVVTAHRFALDCTNAAFAVIEVAIAGVGIRGDVSLLKPMP